MPEDLGAVWREQPEEHSPVKLEHFVNRRTGELFSSTRSEILMSIAAALFFVAMIAWRVPPAQGRLVLLGLVAVIAWILISLYWFRDRIWHKVSRDARAATGLAYYRQQLARRRDHLRNAWVWHGPLILASAIFGATFLGNTFPNPARLWNILPLVFLLFIWTAFGVWRRRREANELQREMDEMDPPSQS